MSMENKKSRTFDWDINNTPQLFSILITYKLLYVIHPMSKDIILFFTS